MFNLYFSLVAYLGLVLFLYFYWNGRYWARKGLRGPRSLPFVGNMLDYVMARKHFGEVYEDIYKAFPKAAYVGIYRLFNEPSILVRDLDVVKTVFIQNFSAFHNNFILIDPKLDPLACSNPFVACGERWRALRSQMGQLFTPSKVKTAFPMICDVCVQLEKFIVKGPNNEHMAFEAKDLCAKFTIEVMATVGFGLEAQTFTNPESHFAQFCENIFVPHFWSYLQTIGNHFYLPVSQIFKLPFIPKYVQDWLVSVATDVIEGRKSEKERRNDFLEMILNTKESNGEGLSENTILGHCATLLLEGFETSSTLMAYCLYQLSCNNEIQKKAQNEMDKVLTKHGGKLTYEALNELTYLDSVLNETLRMHPAMLATIKVSTEEFELPPQYPGSKPIRIPVGTNMVIPVLAIHYDPDIYPDPHIFNPERFNDEAQKARNNCAFLSFGEGPRICIGMRFGMAQSKAGLVTILSKFNVKLSPKTKVPIQMSPTTFLINSQGGIWVQFVPR